MADLENSDDTSSKGTDEIIEISNVVPNQVVTTATTTPDSTGGGEMSDVWLLFTNDFQPQHTKYTTCMHCNCIVSYQKKVGRVKSHLVKCPAFQKLMMVKDVVNHPEWFIVMSPNKKPKHAALGSFMSSMSQTTMTNLTLPLLRKEEAQKIEMYLAMHYYITGTSFCRVEEKNLIEAFRVACPDVVLPNQKKLTGVCLDHCYNDVKARVEQELSNTATLNCLTMVEHGCGNKYSMSTGCTHMFKSPIGAMHSI
jgi:hypothetical protein